MAQQSYATTTYNEERIELRTLNSKVSQGYCAAYNARPQFIVANRIKNGVERKLSGRWNPFEAACHLPQDHLVFFRLCINTLEH